MGESESLFDHWSGPALRCDVPNDRRGATPILAYRQAARRIRRPSHRNPEGRALFGARFVDVLDRGSATLFARLLPIIRKGLRRRPAPMVKQALMPHRLTARARADIDGIADFIAREQDLATAARMVERLDRAFRMLSDHPHSGRSRHHDLRADRRSIAVSRYIVIYRVVRSEAVILRVIDGRRDYPAFMPES